jgi:Holliday junction resolvase
MTRYASKVDANHAAVREALRQVGWTVVDFSRAGSGVFDLLALKPGKCLFVEVKDGQKSASRRRLTPAQVELHGEFARAGWPVVVITSVSEALLL